MKRIMLISTLLLCLVMLGPVSPTIAKHNTEFPNDDCDAGTEDATLEVTLDSFQFTINGHKNPDIMLEKGSCVLVRTRNLAAIEHDFTVVWDSGTPSNETDDVEMIHMDTPHDGEWIEHRWRILDQALTLEYGCEVEGHHAEGMHGTLIIGDSFSTPAKEDDSPGFGLEMAILGFGAILLIMPILRKRN